MLRRIVRDSTVLLAGEAVARLTLFATTVVLARTLGPDRFGLVTFAQVVLGYLLLAGDWGLSTYGVRAIAADPRHWAGVWRGIARVRGGVSLVLVLVATGVTLASRPDPVTGMVLLITFASALPIGLTGDWACRGRGRMRAAALLTALAPLAALALILISVHGPPDVTRVPLARLAAAILAMAVGFVLLRGGAPAEGRAWLRAHGVRSLLGSGLVLLVTNLAVLAYNSADSLMLKGLAGDRVVGYYGSAYRVIQLPMAALYTLTASALPALVRQRASGGAAPATLTRLLALAVGAGGVVAIALWALREPIVRLLYGPAYAPAAAALGVLAFAVPLDFLVSVKGTAYIAAGLERTAAWCAGAGALANVIANAVLIPRYGMLGAAWTTLGTYVLIATLYTLVLDRRLAALDRGRA